MSDFKVCHLFICQGLGPSSDHIYDTMKKKHFIFDNTLFSFDLQLCAKVYFNRLTETG